MGSTQPRETGYIDSFFLTLNVVSFTTLPLLTLSLSPFREKNRCFFYKDNERKGSLIGTIEELLE
jgi:hypothetical protein